MTKVSVIVPVYGVEKYIERCARSLFEQTLDDIEYIFVDDCTKDKSIDILEHVIEDYPNRKSQITILHHNVNKGLPQARKTGISVANGVYIAHCDSDDWVDTDMYRAMYEKAIEENAYVVVCDYSVHDGNKTLKTVQGCHSTDVERFKENLLFQKDSWSLWNKMFRNTSCYKDIIYPKGNMGEDMVICIQMMLQCKTMAYISKPYYKYFVNSTSISNNRSVANHIRNFERLKTNTDLMIAILNEHSIEHKKWVINGLQYNATITLMNVMHNNKECRKLWMNTYPYANWRYMINPYMKVERRFKCLLAILGLYPFKKDRI